MISICTSISLGLDLDTSEDSSAIIPWRRDVELKETVNMIYCHLAGELTIMLDGRLARSPFWNEIVQSILGKKSQCSLE